MTPCIPARVDKRVTLMSSALLMGIFNVFIGPSQIFALPETLVLVVIGLVMSGSCMAPMTIPVLPEMIEASQAKFPSQNARTTNNYVSAIFNTALGLGTCIGPLYGATAYERLNFRLTCDILALFVLAFGITYFACAEGRQAFSRTFGSPEEEKQTGSPAKKYEPVDYPALRTETGIN